MLVVAAQGQAVKLNPKAGQVSDAEVMMDVYQPDTTAAAVYLIDKCDVTLRTDDVLGLDLLVNVYQRIKILKESGKDVTDYKILYSQDGYISNVRVTTYNMSDGKLVKTKLDRKYVFREKVTDNTFSCSFTAPEVRVGSVVEVAYEIKTERFWDIPELVLQRSYPSNMVSASLEYPDFIHVNRMARGYLTPVYKESQLAKSLRNNVIPSCLLITESYSLNDVPAIPREVSSLCPSQYRCAVSYEVSGVTIPGFVHRSYSMKWPDVDKQVRETNIISQCSVKGKFLEPFYVEPGEEKTTIANVRNAVVSAVKWDDTFNMIPENIRDVVKAGKGSSASINAIVASVLNGMGYTVSPVLLRKRSSGLLANFYVRTDAFTSMILKIETPSGTSCYMDAAPDYGYIDVLPPDFLVDEARVYPLDSNKPAYWEKLTSRAMAASVFSADARLQENGTVTGTIGLRAMGAASCLIRQTRDELGSDDAYFEHVEEGESFETLSYEYRAKPYDNKAEFTIEFQQAPVSGGDHLYVKPFLITQYHKGDFPPGERVTPVDFIVLENMTYIYKLAIPDGFQIEQLPPAASIRANGFKATALCRTVANEDGTITLTFAFRNNSLQVPAANYQDLRAFWEQLCNMFEGTIVLKRK